MFFVVTVVAVTLAYLVVATLERVPAMRFRVLPSRRPFLATDMAWFAMAIAATAVSMFVLRPVLTRLEIRPIGDLIGGLPTAVQLVLGLIVFDLVSFLVHVGLHRSDVLWNVHKVHHSTLQLDGLATTRAHMFENMVRFVPGQAVLFATGMPSVVVAATLVIANVYGISNHSNLDVKLPWIETVLVTPRLHRRHHVPSTTQNNFGGMFTVWDRVLGTLLRRDTSDDDRYGVPGEIDSYPQHFATAVRQPVLQIRLLRQERHAPSDLDDVGDTSFAVLAEKAPGR